MVSYFRTMSDEISAGIAKTEIVATIKEEEPQEEEADVNVANIFGKVDDY